MAQLLGFFATSKCSPHVIKWFKQTPQSAHVTVVCARCRSETRVNKIPVEPLLLSPQNKNYFYMYFSGEEVMKADEHEQETSNR